MKNEWKVGDWCIRALDIVQIEKLDPPVISVSSGMFCTAGRFIDELRPLTLRNKRTIEYYEYYLRELSKIDGEVGFNYPRISDHFEELARKDMDSISEGSYRSMAGHFVEEAKRYVPVIQGVQLFRRKQ